MRAQEKSEDLEVGNKINSYSILRYLNEIAPIALPNLNGD